MSDAAATGRRETDRAITTVWRVEQARLIAGLTRMVRDISRAEPARIALIDGWGIHYVPGRGWTYNIWGWSCVRLTVNGGTLRIGTDDAESLAQFILAKISDDALSR